MNNIKAIIIAAVLAPMTLHAAPLTDNHELAKQCHQLSKELNSLKKLETVSFCKDKISSTSNFSEMAGEDLIVDRVYSAKSSLELAIQSLAYSTVEDCIQTTNISNAKAELQKIHDALH